MTVIRDDVAKTITLPTNDLENALIRGSKKIAIIVAGQSNTNFGDNYGENSVPTGALDLGIKQLINTAGQARVGTAGLGNVNFESTTGTSANMGYAYPLAKHIKDVEGLDNILIIPVAFGATGFVGGQWAANGYLYKELIRDIRIANDLGYDLGGMFWSQGESDAVSATASYYKHLLHSLATSVRLTAFNCGQRDGLKIPFVTLDLVTAWVGVDVNRVLVQDALAGVGNVLNYSANADTTLLSPDLDSDTIHYDARQQVELGQRMFDAYLVAKGNTNAESVITVGEYQLLNHLPANFLWGSQWEALESGVNSVDQDYSRLGELWKYCNGGKLKLRMEWTLNTGDVHEIVFEQDNIPFMITPMYSSASLVSVTAGAVFGLSGDQTFNGLTYGENSAICKISSVNQFWGAVGMAVDYNATGMVPIGKTATGADVLATNVKLFAIKE